MQINAQTTLRDLQVFLQGQASDTKIYGSKDQKTGVITLHLKPRSENPTFKEKFQNFCDRISGRAKDRRDFAREGIQSLFDQLRNEAGKKSTLGNILKSVKNQYGVGFDLHENKAHRAGQLLALTNKVVDIFDRSRPPEKKPFVSQGEMALGKLGLGLNNKVEFAADVPKVTVNGPPPYTAKPILINGEQYNPMKCLSSGGYGHVFQYQTPDGKDTVAVKVTIEKSPQSEKEKVLLATAKEIESHRSLMEKVPGSIIGFKDAMRLPDGQVAIITDFAPHGDLQGLGNKINSLIGDENNLQEGQITKAQAKVLMLTLIRDTAVALESIHSKGGSTHFDFKGGNVFIDKTCRPKIGDFGTTYGGMYAETKETPEIDSPSYKAPELYHVAKRQEDEQPMIDKMLKNIAKEETRLLAKDLRSMFPNASKEYSMELAESIFDDREKKLTQEQQHVTTDIKNYKFDNSQKVDVWGLGSLSVEMFTGKPLLSEVSTQFKTLQDDRLAAFEKDGKSLAVVPLENGKLPVKSLGGSTGHEDVDKFVNSILISDPNKRPSSKEVLNHEIFTTTKGVGKPSAYDLLESILKGDKEGITKNGGILTEFEINW